MEELNKKIGERLREIRNTYISKYKISVSQFADMFSETRDKITNYETGRSQIPVSLLVDLYNYGINPVYILTGEESVFATNSKGNKLKKLIGKDSEQTKEIDDMKNNVIIIANADLTKLSIDELLRESSNIKVAANPNIVINKMNKKLN
jgi:hypothetical protein